MKIQCDVCDKVGASVFCPADEAALCHGCDRTIHHANRLASKHKRFSLHHLTSTDSPVCDICRERRAYLFCQEDRAILCRECDLPIHGTNEHTQKHNRFLLTGIKLCASSSADPTSLYSNGSSTDAATATGSEVRSSHSKINRPTSSSNENVFSSSHKVEDNLAGDTGSVSTSSISEYLIEKIPGYRLEDILDDSFPPNGICKNYEHYSASEGQDLEVDVCSFPLAEWVSPLLGTSNLPQIGTLIGIKELPKGNDAKTKGRDNGFTVPENSRPSIKKCRPSR